MEANCFSPVDSEFMNVLRKIYKAPLLLFRIYQTMQRLCELLHDIKKSLGDYLERERSIFSRFWLPKLLIFYLFEWSPKM